MNASKDSNCAEETLSLEAIGVSTKRKNKSLAKEYCEEFTSKTSLHGFQYLGEEKRPKIEKLWWAVMIALSTLVCFQLIYNLWIKWNENPVIVSFAESSTPIWKIPFPAVTVCSEIKSKQSVYNYSDFCGNGNLTEEEVFNTAAVSMLCGQTCLKDREDLLYINESIIDIILDVAPRLREALYLCVWGELYDCEDIFTPFLTEQGLCFTANILDPDDIFRDTVQNKYNFSKHGVKNEGWSIDSGYSKNLPLETYPYRALGTGTNAALGITVRRNKSEIDYMCSSPADGFKIALHAPNVIPRLNQNFFWITLGTTSAIAIKPRMITTSSTLINYEPKRRQCFFSHEKWLRFFKEYTQENCEFECVTNRTMDKCGCVSYAMPRDASMPICSSSNIKCLTSVSGTFFAREIMADMREDNAMKEESKQYPERQCNCLPACSSIVYDYEISKAVFKWEEYLRSWKIDVDFDGIDIGEVELFFKEPQMITSKRSELYGLTDFLANCGGLLGVCLGFSVLSLIEILYFISMRLICNIRRRGSD